VQVKQCYTHGIEPTGKGGKVVSRLLNSAVAAGKRVRSETGESPQPRLSPHTPHASPPPPEATITLPLLVPHAAVPFLHSTHAGISKGAVSISSAAVEFSEVRTPKDIGKEFEDCRIAIIGAGKMSRLLMIHMASQGIKQVTLMNRCVRACVLRRCIACGPHASLHDARCDPRRCTYHDPLPPLLPSLAHPTLFQI
jgi:glutamyl-tRNA reductase